MNASEYAARRLRELRAEAGFSQEIVATAMQTHGFGWSRVTVSELERDSRRLALDSAAVKSSAASGSTVFSWPENRRETTRPHGSWTSWCSPPPAAG